MEYQHGGDVYANQVELDFSVNLNPFGLPASVKEAVICSLDQAGQYPDSRCVQLREAIGRFHKIPAHWILCSNGAADLIFQIAVAGRFKKAVVMAPTFSEYEQALRSTGCRTLHFDLEEGCGFRPDFKKMSGLLKEEPQVLFLCNPNNPTGIPAPKADLEALIRECKEKKIRVVLDECFCDFLDQESAYSLIREADRYPNLLILRAFTKMYAMAGLRLGYGVSGDQDFLEKISKARQPWSVSTAAQAAGIAALEETAYVERTREWIRRERPYLAARLKGLGFRVYDSMVNYLLFKDREDGGEEELYHGCLKHRILIRSCKNYRGLDGRYYRVCIKSREENEALVAVLEDILKQRDLNGKQDFMS